MKLIIVARTQDLFAEYKKNQLKMSLDIVHSVIKTISGQIIYFGFPESEDNIQSGVPYMDLVNFESRLRIETEGVADVLYRLKSDDNYEREVEGITGYAEVLEEIAGAVSILRDISRRLAADKELTSAALNDVEQYKIGLAIATRMLESCIDTHLVGIQ